MFRNHPYRALRCSFRACWRLLIMICHVRSGNITWNEVHHGILFDRRLGVTGRAKYEILAAAVDFCTMVCNHWPWYFPRHFEWKAVESEAESFFFFQCHVCFMERRIFYEMGSIQNVRDSTFNQTNIKHDISSYKRICAEFRVESPADFRFMHSAYHGLGNVFICFQIWSYIHRHGLSRRTCKIWRWRGQSQWEKPGRFYQKCQNTDHRFNYFVPNKANRLTQTGLSWLNQSIEAFMHCFLGVQVKMLSSILDEGGWVKEVQCEFLLLLKGAIRQWDLAKSGQCLWFWKIPWIYSIVS